MAADAGTRSIGDCVEAVDVLGCWTKGKIVKWVNEGELIRPGGDDEEAGPGYEVRFDGWSQEWNRIVPPSEIRDVTVATPPVKTSRRCTPKSVSTLKLHKDDLRKVLVNGEIKEGKICQIDPIRNNVIVVIDGTEVEIQLESFNVHKENKDCSSCCTDTRPKAKKQKTSGLRKHPAVSCQEQQNERMGAQTVETDKFPLQLVLGSSFFEVGEICSFLGNMIVIISSIAFCSRTEKTSVLCKVCTVVGEAVTGIEPDCELKCQASQLQKINRKASHFMKATMKTFQTRALEALGNFSLNSSLSYQREQRRLNVGFLLRESCIELLKSRSLKKTVTNLFDPLDFHIFPLDNPRHSIQYAVEEDFSALDLLMGSKWDVYCISPPAPDEHFYFILAVSVNVNSVKLVITLTK